MKHKLNITIDLTLYIIKQFIVLQIIIINKSVCLEIALIYLKQINLPS